jgi:hypothetical protein
MKKWTLTGIVGGVFLSAALTLGIVNLPPKASPKSQRVEQTREEIGAAIIEAFQSFRESINPPIGPSKEVPNPKGYLLTGESMKGLDEDGLSLANKVLVDFPNEIPGAKSIDKYFTPRAVRTILHIRQAHEMNDKLREAFIESGGKKETARTLYDVKAVQDDAYKILTYLLDNKFIDSVHREGYSEIEYSRPAGCGGSLEPVGDIKNQKCAVDKLWKEKKLKVLPAESYVLHGLAQDVYLLPTEGIPTLEKIKNDSVYDGREDHFLNIARRMHGKDKPLVTIVLGGEHEFGGEYSFKGYKELGRTLHGDNISKWNNENSWEMYSLIEVTPTSYGKKVSSSEQAD